jgi:hypothetical protein
MGGMTGDSEKSARSRNYRVHAISESLDSSKGKDTARLCSFPIFIPPDVAIAIGLSCSHLDIANSELPHRGQDTRQAGACKR